MATTKTCCAHLCKTAVGAMTLALTACTAFAADWTDADNATYTALKTIKGDGKTLIITDIQPTGTDKVMMRFKPIQVSATAQYLFCSRRVAESKVDLAFVAQQRKNQVRIDRRVTDRQCLCTTTTLVANGIYSLVADFNQNKGNTINGVVQEQDKGLGDTAYTPGSKLVLFAGHNGGGELSESTTFSSIGTYYLYCFLLCESDGTLKNCLMPAMRDTDSVVGLFDTVNNKFYASFSPSDGSFAYETFAEGEKPPAGCAVWTGCGDGVSMDGGKNWLGGAVPTVKQDLNFTLAGPTAPVNANLALTCGTLYLGDGEIPAFYGSLAVTNVSDRTKVSVGANMSFVVDGDLEISGSGSQYICNTVELGGVFRVNGKIIAGSNYTGKDLAPSLATSLDGTIAAKGIVVDYNSTDDNAFRLAKNVSGAYANWAIGSDGIIGTGQKSVYLTGNADHAKITAEADFSITTRVGVNGTVTFDTAGHEITISGDVFAARSSEVVVTGSGKVISEYDSSSYNGAYSVAEDATLSVKSSTKLGTGAVTVATGGAFEVADSGSFELGGALALADGACLAFNFTDKVAPVLDVTGKTVTLGENKTVVVKVSAADDVRAKGGENVLTEGGAFAGANVTLASGAPNWAMSVEVNDDGNIVLNAKPRGFVIIVN